MPSIQPYIDAVFSPVRNKCEGKVDADFDALKTAPVEEENKDDQYALFKSFSVSEEGVLQLRTGDFVFFFSCNEISYLGVSIEHFDENSSKELEELMEAMGCQEEVLEYAFFMHMCKDLKGVYTISKKYSSRYLEELLGLGVRESQEGYVGHDFTELLNIYVPVKIYSIGVDSPISFGERKWQLAAKIMLECDSLRPGFIDEGLVDEARVLYDIGNVKYENIYLSLSASHWKYVFLEVYRCVEALYYLPWMIRLKEKIGVEAEAIKLAEFVGEIGWRKDEKSSIKKIFQDMPYSLMGVEDISIAPVFKDLNISDSDDGRAKLAGRIYEIRNQVVHHEDYRERFYIEMTAECWRCASILLYRVSGYYYNKFPSDIKAYNGEL